jgi:succinate dehydrogenase/fumarate reductase iron-sulfur protein
LLGAYQALQEQIAAGTVTMHIRRELLDVVIVDGRARGIVTRDLVTGEIESHAADVVVLATGGYSNVFYLSTNAKASNCTAIWRAHRRGALFGNPCFTQIHPTCIPLSSEHQSKLTLMSESLRNDGRVWVPKKKGETRAPKDIPEDERDYYLENRYPSFGNLVPRDVASRNAKEVCDEGRGVGPHGQGVYLDFADAIQRLGLETVRDKYGNLFDIYERITGEDAYTVPMRICPAPHYTMGGLWVDYHLMSTIPGLFVGGEANFSDHGANRLGASALMQGLADGYFVLPCTVPDYIASTALDPIEVSHPAFAESKAAAFTKELQIIMNLTLRIWRQQNANAQGQFVTYQVREVTPDMSFLEMLDALNEDLLSQGEPPVAFEHDCREGICGSCGFLINGVAHGGRRGTTVCQLSMRFFKDGDTLTLEPWRARAFPVIRDLIVNRSAFDRIIQAGGFISAPTGSAPDANAILVPKEAADTAFDAAACIGCGACVASCPNAAAMLFTSAKITHLNSLPQGQPQRDQRTLSMVVATMNEHFGSCTNHGECEAVCPEKIPLEFIGKMNRDLIRAIWRRHREPLVMPGIVQQPAHEDTEIEVGKT